MSMGRRFAIFASRAMAAAAPQSNLGLTAGGTNLKRAAIYDLTFGSAGAPADNAFLYEAQRHTAAGVGTTTTAPTPLDAGSDTASDTTSVQNNTTDPTLTALTILGYWPVNQRATHRWIADPLGPMIVTATASNGISVWGTHASATVAWSVMCHFYE